MTAGQTIAPTDYDDLFAQAFRDCKFNLQVTAPPTATSVCMRQAEFVVLIDITQGDISKNPPYHVTISIVDADPDTIFLCWPLAEILETNEERIAADRRSPFAGREVTVTKSLGTVKDGFPKTVTFDQYGSLELLGLTPGTYIIQPVNSQK